MAEGRSSREKVLKVVPLLDHIEVKFARSYDKWDPSHMTIYCDPPYETASKCSNPNEFLRGFDHEKFWNTMGALGVRLIWCLSLNLKPIFRRILKIIWTKKLKRSFRTGSSDKVKEEALAIHKSWIK